MVLGLAVGALSSASAQTIQFAAAVHYPVGNEPRGVALGDLNRDSKLDLAVANAGSNSVSILLGNGNGTFAPATSVGVTLYPSSVAIADFNGDGKPDLSVTHLYPRQVAILLGRGDGTFDPPLFNYSPPGYAHAVAVGDLNGDGKPDLVVPNHYDLTTISVLRGNGDGTFANAVNHTVGSNPSAVAIRDLNDDGKQDLVVVNDNYPNYNIGPTVSVLLGNGDATFATPVNYSFGPSSPLYTHALTLADFNDDGNTDLAVGNINPPTMSVLLGNGLGTFAAAVNYAIGVAPFNLSTLVSAAVGDFNGDERMDLAAADSASNKASILIGNGHGIFSQGGSFAVGNEPSSMAAGDLNGDGKTDLAVGNFSSDSVSILLNSSPALITPFSEDPLPATGAVKALHITELRTEVNALRLRLGLSSFGFAGPPTPGSTSMMASDIVDLRTALDQVFDTVGYTRPVYIDPVITAGQTPIRRAHIRQLRHAVLDSNWSVLTADRAGDGTGTVTSSPEGINCGTACKKAYAPTLSVQLTATAANGSVFAGWSGACTGTSASCGVAMSADRTATATFNLQRFTLTVSKSGQGTGTVTSAPVGINCGVDCDESYLTGTSVTLTATASADAFFAGWSGACSGTGACVVTMTNVKSVGATFNRRYTLTVSKDPAGTGNGSVTSNPAGITCGVDCTEDYNSGTSVTLTAAAAAGSYFSNWSGACSGSGTCAVPMTAATSVVAKFNVIQSFTLTVTKSGAGTVISNPAGVNCGATCQYGYDAGTVVTLTPTAPSGQYFSNWTGACSGNGVCSVTMTANTTVGAVFSAAAAYDVQPRDYNMGVGGGCNGGVLGVQFAINAPAGVNWTITWTGSDIPHQGQTHPGALNQSSGTGPGSVIFTVTVASQSPSSGYTCAHYNTYNFADTFFFRFYDGNGQYITEFNPRVEWTYRLVW
jgi:hypothetical protein